MRSARQLPSVLFNERSLVIPHFVVQDVGKISWNSLKHSGIKGVVFDKDNTLTPPYQNQLFPFVKDSFYECLSTFGRDNVIIFSNSAGSNEDAPHFLEAEKLEKILGAKVLRHGVRKPDGLDVLLRETRLLPKELVMVGDRYFTDVLMGNRHGLLTIYTKPPLPEHNLMTQIAANMERFIVNGWIGKINPPEHPLKPKSIDRT